MVTISSPLFTPLAFAPVCISSDKYTPNNVHGQPKPATRGEKRVPPPLFHRSFTPLGPGLDVQQYTHTLVPLPTWGPLAPGSCSTSPRWVSVPRWFRLSGWSAGSKRGGLPSLLPCQPSFAGASLASHSLAVHLFVRHFYTFRHPTSSSFTVYTAPPPMMA